MAEQTVTITGVFEDTGKSSKGSWTRYDVKAGDTKFQTFNDALGQKAKDLKGQSVKITFTEEKRGEYTNRTITALEATGEAPAPRNEKQRSKEEVRRTEAFKIAAALGAENIDQLTELGDAIAAELAGEAVPEGARF